MKVLPIAVLAVCVGWPLLHAQGNPSPLLPGYEAGCAAGNAMDCGGIGVFYAVGNRGLPKDLGKAAEFYLRACDGGALAYCNNLAVLTEWGGGVPKDEARAVELWRKSCDGGIDSGCSGLARMYESGQGVAKDETQAVALYAKACRGFSFACLDLARMYEHGTGVPVDLYK